MAMTGSLLASALGVLGSTFPDRVERILWKKISPRHHRKTSHWFVLYVTGFVLCFSVWGDETPPCLGTFSNAVAKRPQEVGFSCAAFWFLGGLIHILGDACCGRVPLLIPWRKTFGWKFFRMSAEWGKMSTGEVIFTGLVVLSCLWVWLSRYTQVLPGWANVRQLWLQTFI
jgi:hypothetical protein